MDQGWNLTPSASARRRLPRINPLGHGRDHHRQRTDGYGVILAAAIHEHYALLNHGGPWRRLELGRAGTVRVHLIRTAAWAIRCPPGDRTVDVIDLCEVAIPVKRALHHSDQGLASTHGWRNGARAVHLNPVGALKGAI